MSDYGMADVVLRCLNDDSARVRQLALEVFCAFTANEKLRPYLLDELKALDVLRKFADQRNLYMWYAVTNLADHNEEVCKEIAHDEYFMESLMYLYERSVRMQDLYYLRPIYRLLSNLARYPESCEILSTTYKEKMELLLWAPIMPETQSLTNSINMRLFLARNQPKVWAELGAELMTEGITQEEPPQLTKWAMAHQALAVMGTGLVWSFWRSKRLASKYFPLNRMEREWVRRAVWRSPLAAVALSFCWIGVERICKELSENIEWEGYRDARKVILPYFGLLPIYWFALNYLGPFATIPSLIRIRYNETMPPYNFLLREPALDLFETIGLVEERHADPMNPERPITSMADAFYESHQTKLKIKQQALAEQQQRSSWKFW